jgi:hypothetical protein
MRSVGRINPFMRELQILWEQNPDLRFGQLVNIIDCKLESATDPFYVEDNEWREAILKLIK